MATGRHERKTPTVVLASHARRVRNLWATLTESGIAMNAHTVLTISGPLLLLLALPLWGRRVPRNRFYGVRTRRTLTDEAVWYDVNARSGRDLAIAAALYTFVSFVIGAAGSAWPPEMRTLALAVALIVALAWVSVRCARWLARIPTT